MKTLRNYYIAGFMGENYTNERYNHMILESTLREMFEEDVNPKHVLFHELSTNDYFYGKPETE